MTNVVRALQILEDALEEEQGIKVGPPRYNHVLRILLDLAARYAEHLQRPELSKYLAGHVDDLEIGSRVRVSIENNALQLRFHNGFIYSLTLTEAGEQMDLNEKLGLTK